MKRVFSIVMLAGLGRSVCLGSALTELQTAAEPIGVAAPEGLSASAGSRFGEGAGVVAVPEVSGPGGLGTRIGGSPSSGLAPAGVVPSLGGFGGGGSAAKGEGAMAGAGIGMMAGSLAGVVAGLVVPLAIWGFTATGILGALLGLAIVGPIGGLLLGAGIGALIGYLAS